MQDKGIRGEYLYIAEVLRGEKRNEVIDDAFLGSETLLEAIGK